MGYDADTGERTENADVHQERMNVFRKQYEGNDLITLVKAMAAVKKVKEDLEEQLKAANAEYDVLRFEAVPERMETDGVENIRYDGIGRVSTSADLRLATNKATQADLFAWFRKRKLGDLIQDTINGSSLKAWVKRRLIEGKELPPSEILKVTPITRASITKG